MPAVELLPGARAWATELAEKPPLALRYILEAVDKGGEAPLVETQALEASLFGLVASTADMREGIAAFLEKRRPLFRGE